MDRASQVAVLVATALAASAACAPRFRAGPASGPAAPDPAVEVAPLPPPEVLHGEAVRLLVHPGAQERLGVRGSDGSQASVLEANEVDSALGRSVTGLVEGLRPCLPRARVRLRSALAGTLVVRALGTGPAPVEAGLPASTGAGPAGPVVAGAFRRPRAQDQRCVAARLAVPAAIASGSYLATFAVEPDGRPSHFRLVTPAPVGLALPRRARSTPAPACRGPAPASR